MSDLVIDGEGTEVEDGNFELDESSLDVEEYFGDKQARWFQIAAKNGTIDALVRGVKRILIKQPTGSGKTITIGLTMDSAELRAALSVPLTRRVRVLFVAHKHRLLTQAERTFAEASGVELILQSCFSDIPADVMEKGWDICVIDEAHHEAMSTIQMMLEKIGDFPIIGLTATDERADGCVIKFEEIIEPITREDAVEQGYLAETRLHSIVDPTSGSVSKADLICSVLTEYHNEMGQMMIFVKTVKESEQVHAHLVAMGKLSVLISKQTERFVNLTLDKFSRGEIQFIVNCNKINEGVDVKGCTDVFCGRQYGSYPQLNQVIGRAARPDSACNVWELINPLNGNNLDTTVIVGTPEMHRLLFQRKGEWVQKEFDYTSKGSVSPEFSRKQLVH